MWGEGQGLGAAAAVASRATRRGRTRMHAALQGRCPGPGRPAKGLQGMGGSGGAPPQLTGRGAADQQAGRHQEQEGGGVASHGYC